MRKWSDDGALVSLVILVVLLAGLVFGPKLEASFTDIFSPKAKASSTLFIDVGGMGHGSGVYIGNGYVLTAAHVAEENVTLTATDSLNNVHSVEVLWRNKLYDVALLKIDAPENVEARHLSCIIPPTGADLRFEGNPKDAGLSVMWGKVSQGKAVKVGPWVQGVLVDAQIIPGMSGGPVFNTNGDVVGLNVGTYNGYAFGIIVPGATICNLLAR